MAGNDARTNVDSGWKDIIEDFTEEFFEFYFPEAHREIDFKREITFLDKELQGILPESEMAERETDKLIELYWQSGDAESALVHVTVTGQPDPEFAYRIFMANCRIYDRLNRHAVSLALLVDGDPAFRPSAFQEGQFGSEIFFSFPIVKLIDFDPAELAGSDNPFALVTQMHLASLQAGTDARKRFDARVMLTRCLYQAGFDRERTVKLFRFMARRLPLPDDLAAEYRKELEAVEAELTMPYITGA